MQNVYLLLGKIKIGEFCGIISIPTFPQIGTNRSDIGHFDTLRANPLPPPTWSN